MERLPALLRERILVLDGAMGTMVQRYQLSRGRLPRRAVRRPPEGPPRQHRPAVPDQARRRPRDPRGVPRGRRRHRQHQLVHRDPDRPGRLRAVGRRRRDQRGGVAAGARGRGRRRGRATAGRATSPGSLGPTNRTGSISPGRQRPRGAQRQLRGAGRGLSRGGRGPRRGRRRPAARRDDLRHAQREGRDLRHRGGVRGAGLPASRSIVSGTIVDASGRTLSGQTLEAFWTSIRHANPMLVGLNCALGAKQLREHVVELSRLADVPLAAYPNAGLPNELGGYDETPEPDRRRRWASGRARACINLAGSCCGSTPEHTAAIVDGGRRRRAARRPAARATRPGSPASSRSRSRCPAARSSTSASGPTSPARASSPA